MFVVNKIKILWDKKYLFCKLLESNCCDHILLAYYHQTKRSFVFQWLPYEVVYSLIGESQSNRIISDHIIFFFFFLMVKLGILYKII